MVCEAYKESSVFRIGGDEFVVVVQGSDYKARHEIFDDLKEVRLAYCFAVDKRDGGFQGRIVEDTVLTALNLVGGGKNGKVCGVGEKQWRHGGEAVAHGD